MQETVNLSSNKAQLYKETLCICNVINLKVQLDLFKVNSDTPIFCVGFPGKPVHSKGLEQPVLYYHLSHLQR